MSSSTVVVDIVREWLPRIGAQDRDPQLVAAEVTEQIAALPSPLRVGVRGLGTALSLLPRPVSAKLAPLPVSGEYIRLVRTLTTVVCLAAQGSER